MDESTSIPADRDDNLNNGSQFLHHILKNSDSSDVNNTNLSSSLVTNDQKTNSPDSNNMIHSSRKKLVTCQYCGKVLSKKHINRHIRRHTDPASLTTTCDICGDNVNKDHLERHRLQQTDPAVRKRTRQNSSHNLMYKANNELIK